jgi:class 3 adenylate cyclase
MAVQAAVDSRTLSGASGRDRSEQLSSPFPIGVGVRIGPVAAALLGSLGHVEDSVFGDVVKLANRLQRWRARS